MKNKIITGRISSHRLVESPTSNDKIRIITINGVDLICHDEDIYRQLISFTNEYILVIEYRQGKRRNIIKLIEVLD